MDMEMDTDTGVVTINLNQLVEKLMCGDTPLSEMPTVHKRLVEANKVFAARIFEGILNEVGKGNSVRIKNFGTYSCRLTKDRLRNPQTGETAEIKNTKRLRFSSSDNTIPLINED